MDSLFIVAWIVCLFLRIVGLVGRRGSSAFDETIPWQCRLLHLFCLDGIVFYYDVSNSAALLVLYELIHLAA